MKLLFLTGSFYSVFYCDLLQAFLLTDSIIYLRNNLRQPVVYWRFYHW